MKNSKPGVLAVCFCSILLGACGSSFTYSAEAVDGTVVDDATGQPLAGVPVVAYWELHRGSFTGDSLPCGAANVEEAVTDGQGRFHLPAWGPFKSECSITDGYPFIYIFKPGYEYLGLSNRTATPRQVSVSRSDWDGKTIRMKRYPDLDLSKTGLSSYQSYFNGLSTTLSIFILHYPKECNWKKIPNMLREIDAVERQFKSAGNDVDTITTELISNDEFIQKTAQNCGSPKEFIEGLGK